MGEDNQRYGTVNPGIGIALAPDITTAIVNGRQPQQLSAKTLMRKASRLPADWTEQRTLLGF
jgi:site-specific DNA recombinase